MIIKIIGLSLLVLFMFALGYVCGVIMTGFEYETGGKDDERREV